MKKTIFLLFFGLVFMASCQYFDKPAGQKEQAKEQASPLEKGIQEQKQQPGGQGTEATNPSPGQGNPKKAEQLKRVTTDKPIKDLDEEELKTVDPLYVIFGNGVEHLRAEKFEEAINDFTRVIGADPKNFKAYYNRGFAYYYLNEYEKATADLKKAVEYNPKDQAAYLYLGLIGFNSKDYPKAIAHFTKATEIDPEYSTAYYNRGIARGQLRDYAGAVSDFSRAIEINSTYHEAFFNRGLANFLNHDTNRACEDWNHALSMGSAQARQAVDLYCKSR